MVETLFIVSLKMFATLGVAANTVDYITTFFITVPPL
jgi:hypothetical protein